MSFFRTRSVRLFATVTILALGIAPAACAGEPQVVKETVVVEKEVEKPVVQTVVVEKEVPGEKVVETVVVEKQVEVAGETVVQTVVVEKEVPGEKVVETVVVEKEVEKQVEVVVTATPRPLPESPFIVKDPDPDEYQWPKLVTDSIPTSFQEAPMLADRVAKGELPPVEERLPKNPLVIQPAEGIGEYGGTWHRAFTGPADGQNMERPLKDHLLFFDTSMTKVQPNIAERWRVNDDATEFTFTLREGLKWSDGDDFTTEDIMFWVNQMLLNEDINPAPPAWTVHGGELLKFEALDDITFKVTAAEPYGLFPTLVASVIVAGPHTRGDSGGGLYAPSHYLKQFHPDFVGLEEANNKAKDAGFDNWAQYFLNRNHANANPDSPMMTAWHVTQSINTSEWRFERNPYYWAVDPEGNQLPYMDEVVLTLAEDLEVLNLRAIAGNFTVQGRHIDVAKLPVFLQNAPDQNYEIQFWRQPESGIANLYFNESWDGDEEIASFVQNPDFRKALSKGLERDQINEAFFLGLGETTGLCRGFDDSDNPGHYIGEEYVQFDPDKANAMLDELGLDDRDGQGFRLMPSGNRLTLVIAAAAAAFEDYAGISEMVARQWEENLGVATDISVMERSLWTQRGQNNELMIQIWESSGRDAAIITPQHLLPVAGNRYIDVEGTKFFDGEGGREPVSPFIKEQQRLYAEGITTSDPGRRAEIAREAVALNCRMANPVTTVMNKPTYVTAKDNNVRNIPNPLPFSYHSQTSGNGFPETWWLEQN